MIEKCFRGVHPSPVITAPLPLRPDYRDEDLRLRSFLQSENTRAGRVAPLPPPNPDTRH